MCLQATHHHLLLLFSNGDGKCRDSSVGIVTAYRLDDRGTGVRVPVGFNNFLLCTSSRYTKKSFIFYERCFAVWTQQLCDGRRKFREIPLGAACKVWNLKMLRSHAVAQMVPLSAGAGNQHDHTTAPGGVAPRSLHLACCGAAGCTALHFTWCMVHCCHGQVSTAAHCTSFDWFTQR